MAVPLRSKPAQQSIAALEHKQTVPRGNSNNDGNGGTRSAASGECAAARRRQRKGFWQAIASVGRLGKRRTDRKGRITGATKTSTSIDQPAASRHADTVQTASLSSASTVMSSSTTFIGNVTSCVPPAVRKSVRFPNDLMVTYIPVDERYHEDYDDKRQWFQHDDYMRFERDMACTAFDRRQKLTKRRHIPTHLRMLYHHHQTDASCTVRGIETLCDNKLRNLQNHEREDMADAIHDEMTRQIQRKTYPDPEGFRAVSLLHSENARQRALQHGMEDAKIWDVK